MGIKQKGDGLMSYYPLTIKKHHFIVTPEELRLLLHDYHHVVINTGVHKNYTESDPNDFFFKYESLYQKLKNGEKLVWKNDYPIAEFTIGITRYLENCLYEPSNRLSSPNFLEPCPWIHTFCFAFWKDQLSTAFVIHQFTENVCGLCLNYPTKVDYLSGNSKHAQGITHSTDFDDFQTYEKLLFEIKKITNPLKLGIDGKIRRTAVRISNEAKKDIVNFYFFASNGITIL
jgi:hypothetical protein